MMRWATGMALGLTACAPGEARVLTATPATLAQVLAGARGGDTVRLAPGDYGTVTIARRSFAPAIIVEAADARFTGIVINAAGVRIRGGAVTGPGGKSYGVSIRQTRDIRIEGMTISGAHRGIVVDRSEDVALIGNTLTGLISDGIDMALSRRVLVDANRCRDFAPNLAIYDASGARLRDGDHPDCIQAWSRPAAPPSADLTIVNNVIEGNMQGIFLGNHVRDGVDDGGFDRITVKNNRVTVAFGHGIRVNGARDSVVTGNIVRRAPGAMLPNKPVRVRAVINVDGERNHVCGNIVADVPASPAAQPCR